MSGVALEGLRVATLSLVNVDSSGKSFAAGILLILHREASRTESCWDDEDRDNFYYCDPRFFFLVL